MPIGVPASDATVAVRLTGWPREVVALAGDRLVVVSAAVTRTEDIAEVEPAFALSPL